MRIPNGGRGLTVAMVLAAALLALLTRALDIAQVFGANDGVFLYIADSAYHARRALFTFTNFPEVLQRDPYIAYPDGAVVPMPPLYDWTVGAVARVFGDSVSVFERVAAWVSPVFGALTVIPVYTMGRIVGGHRVGLGSAAIFAVLPASTGFARIGDVDSHAAVACLAAVYLALVMALARPNSRRRQLVVLCGALVLVRVAMLLSWSGSLLYLGLAESVILLAGLLAGRVDLFTGQAVGCVAAAAVVSAWVGVAPVPIGGPFSTTTLSWIHVLFLVYFALVAGGLALIRDVWRRGGLALRLGCAAVLAATAAGCLVLLVPDLVESLARGLSFLSKSDDWAETVPEQNLLFRPQHGFARAAVWRAHVDYGFLAYAIPLTPLAALAFARDPRVRVPAVCLACWTAVLSVLALAQLRFGSDFAPVGSVGFGLLLAGLGHWIQRRLPARAARALVVCAGVALLWPALASVHLPKVPAALAYLRDPTSEPAGPTLPGVRTLTRFLRTVGAVTPETSGYFDPEIRPEYGILCWPPHANVLNYAARRASPASAFGPYLDREKLRATLRFYFVHSEQQAVGLAEQLDIRYAVTFDREDGDPHVFTHRLHRTDGSAVGAWSHVERLRLVIEQPPGGTHLPTFFPSRKVKADTIPFKLFEIVKGAVLEVHSAPGARVDAEVWLTTPTERRFPYRATAIADTNGVARLRVAYATQTEGPTRSEGPYRIRTRDVELRAPVSDADVREGTVLRVE